MSRCTRADTTRRSPRWVVAKRTKPHARGQRQVADSTGSSAAPWFRARETAEIVGAALDVRVDADPLWMEHDNGPLAGLSAADAERRFPTPAFRSRWTALTAEGGESMEGLHRRASEALEALHLRSGERVLVVAHGGVLNAALRVLLGASHQTHFFFGDNGLAEVVLPVGSDEVRLVSLTARPMSR